MQIVIYSDESGTHDLSGSMPGSETTVVGGYFAWEDDWAIFSEKWAAILNKHSADYFHYSEVRRALSILEGKEQFNEEKDSKNPFLNWTLEKAFEFLFSLAQLIGESPIYSVGGFTNTTKFHNSLNKGQVPWNVNPTVEDKWVYYFFRSVFVELNRRMPFLTAPIMFTFDHKIETRWVIPIKKAFTFCRSQDPRIKDYGFADDKHKPNNPLQAADMYAYRSRQIAHRLLTSDFSDERPEIATIDGLLFKREFAEMKAGNIPDWPSLLQALSAT